LLPTQSRVENKRIDKAVQSRERRRGMDWLVVGLVGEWRRAKKVIEPNLSLNLTNEDLRERFS